MFLYHRATWGADEASGALGIDFIKATSALVGSGLHNGEPTKSDSETRRRPRGRPTTQVSVKDLGAGSRRHLTGELHTKRLQPARTRGSPSQAPHHHPHRRRGRVHRTWDVPIDKAGRRQKVIQLGHALGLVQVRKSRHDDEKGRETMTCQPPRQPTGRVRTARAGGRGWKSSGRRRGHTRGRRQRIAWISFQCA